MAILKWAWDNLSAWALVILGPGVVVAVACYTVFRSKNTSRRIAVPTATAALVVGAVLTGTFLAVRDDGDDGDGDDDVPTAVGDDEDDEDDGEGGGGDDDVRSADGPAADDCGRHPAANAIDVMVVWELAELRAFCQVVGAYPSSLRVRVTSVGPAIGRAVETRLAAGDPPDVAIIPQPSLIRGYAAGGSLCPTLDDVAQRIPDQWNELVTEQERGSGQSRVYGAVVKGAHKSLFWYRRDVFGRLSDWSWRDLTSFLADNAGTDDDRFADPLAIAAGDRWPLTDWFENQLAGTDPDLYDRMADGRTVRWDEGSDRESLERVLADIAAVWDDPRVFAGGPEGAERSSWSDLPRQLDDRQAALAFGPSFLAGQVDDLADGWNEMWPVTFPELARGTPLVVGGDFAVVPKVAGACTRVDEAQDFVLWLTDTPAMLRWSVEDDGFMTPNAGSPYLQAVEADDVSGRVRAWLTNLIIPEAGETLHFDLSDDQFTVANEGDPGVTWAIFHDFFGDVTGDVRTDCAVGRAIVRLEAAYEREPPVLPC